ncbi:dihydropyrimidinase [Bythopirellula polymerisocia]|uniref:D-hydantoinase n=1 Tax=Bythopirellula polymerisocia TaxID=2528003 RepID=A0A5C6CML4_9BACT|nr:dihydropyrimidinase [Bythopirellula polymerisocia]TWU25648.1 D-hydantoinase [Bythopirellula polymerisocia]
MSLLIKNGRIVTASDDFVGDILCEGEVISKIAPHLDAKADEVIDAAGKYVFPGFIDPHVHIYLPFMGTYAKDTYETASRAALVGGTTTLIEMCCPARSDDPLESYELWLSRAELSACDYSFHIGVSRFDDETAGQLREIVRRGIASFKIFLAYKGAFGINDQELFNTLKLAKELGVIVTAHCENETLVAELQARLLSEEKTGPEWQNESRPPQVEAEGVHHLMTFAEMTGAHVYCVHTSCREALKAVQEAHLRGVHAWVESVIPHFVLDKSYTEKPEFEGAKYVMSPPLRDASHQDALWAALRSRLISTVGTDHAPFDFVGQKEMGRGDFTKIPNGIPSVEDRVNILYTHGVCRGRIDLNTFVDAASTQAARIFGLYPRKGTIQVGSDADLVIYDPDYRGTLTVATQEMAVDYNAFEGWKIEGRPEVVTVRGKVQVQGSKFVGELGHGQLMTREPSHF